MMKIKEDKKINDIRIIKQILLELGFVCNSHPSAKHLIYSKNQDVISIRNCNYK